MEEVHIKLEPDEALFIKRGLLNSEVSALEVLKGIKKYKALKSAEKITREKFKKILSELKAQVTELKDSFPNEEDQEKQMKLIRELYDKKRSREGGVLEEPREYKEQEDEREEDKETKEEKQETKKTSPKKAKKKESSNPENLELIENELKGIKEKLAGLG